MIPTEILRKVRQIQIRTNKVVDDILAGQYESVFRGRGMEFDEVREYMPGDDVRTIDWNVTARMGHPYVKRFVEERELTVMLCVDASSSGAFGTTNKLKKEIAAELCALLAFSAIKNNDKVGLIMFTDEVEKFVPPKKGKKHVLRVIRELLYFEPRNVKTDIAMALQYLNKVIPRRTVVFLVSDFIASDYQRDIRLSGKRHDLVAVNIIDPRELELPNVGLIELEDAESGERVLIDTRNSAARRKYGELCASELDERKELFRSTGVDFIEINTGRQYVNELIRFFKMRERRL